VKRLVRTLKARGRLVIVVDKPGVLVVERVDARTFVIEADESVRIQSAARSECSDSAAG